jgi:hypothetical protein
MRATDVVTSAGSTPPAPRSAEISVGHTEVRAACPGIERLP